MFSLAPIPSVEVGDDGAPLFHIYPNGQADFSQWAKQEADGGVDAEFRVYLNSQMQDGDLLLDLAPGLGFLAVSVLAGSGGAVRIVTVSDDQAAATALEQNGRSAGGTIESVTWSQVDAAGGLLAVLGGLAVGKRLYIRSGAEHADRMVAMLWPLFERRLVAGFLLDPTSGTMSTRVREGICKAVRMPPHTLAERDGELLLLAADAGDAASPMIAIPTDDAIVSVSNDAPRGADPEETGDGPVSFHYLTPFCRTGYGVAGANLIDALARLGADVAFHPIGSVDPSIVQVPTLQAMRDRARTMPSDAPSVRMSQQFDLLSHVGTGPRIGFPIFEIDRFYAQELVHLRAQDRLLVCSDWARTVMRCNGLTEIPIDVVPLGVDRRIFHEELPGAPPTDDTVFIQIGKIEPRKGQLDLLRAFEKAFTPTDRVRLVLHCHNPFLKAVDIDALVAPFRSSPMADRIALHLDPLPTQHDVARAIQHAHCGVFCSRAEGWNLEALEVLSIGKPLIATYYSAHTEFLTPENALLVEIDRLEPRGVGSWAAFGRRQEEALIAHLREVHRRRSEGTLEANLAGMATARRFSWEHAAEALRRAVAASC